MEQEAKLMLYNQLKEMEELNQKEDARKIISEEGFAKLSDKEILKYVFEYRDNETDFGDDIYYIEMPDIDLEGQDLSDLHIGKFMLSRTEGNNKIASRINLKDTGIEINLNNIGISEQTQDDIGIADQVIDFSNVDFTGCNLYGILPDEYETTTSKIKNKITVKGKENLAEEYLKRREEHHLSPEQKQLADRAYERLIDGKSLKGMKGNKEHIDLTDYDFSGIKEYDYIVAEKLDYDIEILDTGIDKEKIEKKLAEKIINTPINKNNKGKIVKLAYEKGDMDFVNKYWNEIDKYDKGEIVILAYEKGDMNFVNKYWNEINNKGEIVILAYEKGNMDFVNKYWNEIYVDYKGKIAKEEYKKGNIDFVERHFEELTYGCKLVIAEEECKKGNYKYIKEFLQEENEKTLLYCDKAISFDGKILTCSGRILSDELSRDKIDKDLILALIRAGSGLEYVEYDRSYGGISEYTPTLYQALKIEDESMRKEIVSEMLKAGVNPNSKYVVKAKRTRSRPIGRVTAESCLDVNNGELKEIMRELGMTYETNNDRNLDKQNVKRSSTNKELVAEFLTTDVGLNEEEITVLEDTYKGLGRDVYTSSIERLGMQKEILDACNASKQAFTKDSRILMNDPQVLYARYMFYNENGITIIPDRLNTTLGISKKGFSKNFGGSILEKGDMEDNDYDYQVKKELLKRYPMPQSREELKKVLNELEKEEIGG